MLLKGQNVTFEKSRVTHSATFAFFGAKAVHGFQPKIGHHQGFVPRKLRFYTIKLLSIEKHNFDMGIKDEAVALYVLCQEEEEGVAFLWWCTMYHLLLEC